jgi:hydroxypyruvate reductase
MAWDISSMKRDAIQIFTAAFSAVEPSAAVKRVLKIRAETLIVAGRGYDLNKIAHIYVIGAGKASAAMAKAVEDLLIDRISDGAVTVKHGYVADLRVIRLTEAGHPVPDENGVLGSERILEVLKKATEKDLVISLISGGGSALTPLPVEGISLADKQATTRSLLNCGATINELNTIRKHLSRIKGGGLARIAYPASVVNLMLSDVIGDSMEVIASGLCVPDSTTFQDCQAVVGKYELEAKLPPSVMDYIRRGAEGRVPETPKPGDPAFEMVQNIIIGSNIVAVKAAEKKARELGYHTRILSTFIEGETREIARVHSAIVKEIHRTGNPLKVPACVISGGETTVTIRGAGLGGRNQEFALAAVPEISGLNHTVILSGGTDGSDGPTDAAGAIADSTTWERAQELGLDPKAYLDNNDSYHFFERLGDLLITGPTNTNVMDVRIILAGPVGKSGPLS